MRVYFLILVALLLVLPASAKNDAYVEDLLSDWGGIETPFVLPYPTEWKELHGRLGVFGDVDAFSFTFDEAFEDWSIEVRVPVCGAHFDPVYPSVAVIGVGLETPEDAVLPFTLEEGLGAILLTAGERPEIRQRDTEFSFFYESPDANYMNYYYEEETLLADIPQAGDYTLAIWEPNGHVGAYFLWLGNEHPNDMGYRDMSNLEETFRMIGTGAWMGQDCNAPLNAASCPSATELTGNFPELDFPQRNELGETALLMGTVYDALTCLPLAGAEIDFELGSETGTIFTNLQGAYRIASLPESQLDTGGSINLYISALGYEGAVIEHLLDVEGSEAAFNISLGQAS